MKRSELSCHYLVAPAVMKGEVVPVSFTRTTTFRTAAEALAHARSRLNHGCHQGYVIYKADTYVELKHSPVTVIKLK